LIFCKFYSVENKLVKNQPNYRPWIKINEFEKIKLSTESIFLDSTMVQLIGNLAVDARSTAPSCHCISASVALQTVLLSQLSSKEQERDAGSDEREQNVETTALTCSIGALAEETASTERSTQAWKAKIIIWNYMKLFLRIYSYHFTTPKLKFQLLN